MPGNRPEADTGERITALETNMGNVLAILAKREDYQASVLVKLTQIEMKQDQALAYQKTCDAERSAHGTRIGNIENGLAFLKGKAAAISAAVSFVLTAAGIWYSGRHQ